MASLKETPRGAAWPIIYLHALLQENKRPSRWMTTARATIVRLADWLVAHQLSELGTGGYKHPTATATGYGGFPREGVSNVTTHVYAEDVGAALLALVRAWQVTGTQNYLIAARHAATCLRRMQCGGIRNAPFLASDVSSTRLPIGGHAHYIIVTLTDDSTSHGGTFYAGDLIAIAGLNALKQADGDSTYGDATAVGEFPIATAATLSSAIDTARSFWQSGAPDSNGATVVGLGSATPRESYSVGSSLNPTPSSWVWAWIVGTNSYVTSRNAALAAYALYAVDGYSALVADLWTWLRATQDDPTLHLNTALSADGQAQLTLGTFDPTIAPAAEILVMSGGVKANKVGAAFFAPLGGGVDASGNYQPGPLYDFGSAGLLAAITAAQVGTTKPTKVAIGTQTRRLRSTLLTTAAFGNGSGQTIPASTVQWMPSYSTVDDVNLRGKCGLNYQTAFKERLLETTSIYALNDVVAASMMGLLYRQQPYIYGVQA